MRENEILFDLAETINNKMINENLLLKKEVQALKQTIGHLSRNQR